MRHVIIHKLGFVSFAKLSSLVSIHIGLILALLFLITNNGRTVNFGTYYLFDNQADWLGSFFILLGTATVTFLLSLLSYLPIALVLKVIGGIKVTGEIDR